MTHFTDALYAVPSFLDGAARIFDFSGSMTDYNTSETPSEADCDALRRDWLAVNADLMAAIQKFERSQKAA